MIKQVVLPYSKSLLNRILMLYAINGADLPNIPNMPNDSIRLYHILTANHLATTNLTVDCGDSGAVLRFLLAYYAIKDGVSVVLDGTPRLRERPIGQLVDALRSIGATIHYLGAVGYAPIRVVGTNLRHEKVVMNNPLSSQFVSALLLIGIEVETDCESPYIRMTRSLISNLDTSHSDAWKQHVQCDWSSAAFWYEYVALHADAELLLCGLMSDDRQADEAASWIFAKLGVKTTLTDKGMLLTNEYGNTHDKCLPTELAVDFTHCPDLYPAVFLTCFRLGIVLNASGTEHLPLKESDRLSAMNQLFQRQSLPMIGDACKIVNADDGLMTYDDHRLAMAFICADYQVDNISCILKSYPNFDVQWKQVRQSSK